MNHRWKALALFLVGSVAVVGFGIAALPASSSPAPPLAKYPGFGYSTEQDEKQYAAEDMARQRAIAECMESAGFPYVVRPTSVGISGVSNPVAMEALLGTYETDPNIEYAESLDESERRAYYEAWLGVPDGLSDASTPLLSLSLIHI